MKLRQAFTVASCLLSFHALSASEVVEQVSLQQKSQIAHNQEREARFENQEAELLALKQKLQAEHDRLQQTNSQLSETFTANELQLAELEHSLRLETSSLGEVFGVARQTAKELNERLRMTVGGAGHPDTTKELAKLVTANRLPNMAELTGLWHLLEQQIHQQSTSQFVQVNQVMADGQITQQSLLQLGAFALIGQEGFVNWQSDTQLAKPLQKQPSNTPTIRSLMTPSSDEFVSVTIDPTHGQVFEQLANQPSLTERIESGGIVGGAIVALFLVGLLIAVVRGYVVLTIGRQISLQLKSPNEHQDNPLGRVLSVLDEQPNRTPETLELRLLEVILDEQSHLEKGLSMLKLLAALAPMLGLLGTVTGMIETFQVITLFGRGDAKVMAGGISTALVTTVMGLVAAMPLLLAHNLLSTQAEKLRNILEKQGVSMVAEQAERASLQLDEKAG